MIPKITPQKLERLLEILPDPNEMKLYVSSPRNNPIDYSALFQRLHEDHPATERLHLEKFHLYNMSVSFRPYYPPVGAVLELYTASYNYDVALSRAARGSRRKRSGTYNPNNVRVLVTEISWDYTRKIPNAGQWEECGGRYPLQITLTAPGIRVICREESPLVQKVREVLNPSKLTVHLTDQDPSEWGNL